MRLKTNNNLVINEDYNDGVDFTTNCTAKARTKESNLRNNRRLIVEADTLFEEDKNFLPIFISVKKKPKRKESTLSTRKVLNLSAASVCSLCEIVLLLV